jgi:hypothetical protein
VHTYTLKHTCRLHAHTHAQSYICIIKKKKNFSQVKDLSARLSACEADAHTKAAAIVQLDKEVVMLKSQLTTACSEKDALALKIAELERVQVCTYAL